MEYEPDLNGTRTTTFTPYEPILGGMGVVFNIWIVLVSGTFKQGVSKQRAMIAARCRATRGAHSVLASDCRALFGRPSARKGLSHLCDNAVAGPTARRDNVLASKCEYPPFRYPPFKCAR